MCALLFIDAGLVYSKKFMPISFVRCSATNSCRCLIVLLYLMCAYDRVHYSSSLQRLFAAGSTRYWRFQLID